MTKIKKEKRSIKKKKKRIDKGNTMYQNERLFIKILLIKNCTTNRHREDELLMVEIACIKIPSGASTCILILDFRICVI